MTWFALPGFALLIASSVCGAADITNDTIRIGVLTDMGGPNADATGEGSVTAARLAAEDSAALLPGIRIEVVSADHQNKADIASSIAREWIATEGMNVIADVPVSPAGLAVAEATRGQPRTVFIASGTGTSDLTGKQCSPNTLHWTYDSYANGSAVAHALSAEGAKTWFFITADYSLGHALQRDTTGVIDTLGGKVLGAAMHPNFNTDFSTQLLAAQSSRADVIALANATGDLINTIKQAREFGVLGGRQRFAATVMMVTDVQALGLDMAQGLYLAEPFYWDLNDGTRAFSRRFAAHMAGRKPTMLQAGVYSGLLDYLKAVKDTQTTRVPEIMADLRAHPPEDPVFGQGIVRPDGRVIHDYYLFQVKRPEQSQGPWDDYNVVARIPKEDAFRPLGAGNCPLVVRN